MSPEPVRDDRCYERHASASDTVQVTGNGTAAPVATLSAPGSVDLGNVKVGTTSSGTQVQVTNTGNLPCR